MAQSSERVTLSSDASLPSNWLLEFLSKDQQTAFVEFKVEHFGSLFFTSVVAIGITCGLTLFWILGITTDPNAFTVSTGILFLGSVLPLVWFIVYLKRSMPVEQHIKKYHIFFLAENAFLVAFAVCLDLTLFVRIANGTCSDISFTRIWSCNVYGNRNGMPHDTILCIAFLPLLCSICLPFISAKVTFLVYGVNVVVVVCGISYLGATSAAIWFILAALISTSVCYIHTVTQMQLFKYFVRSRMLQQQREDILKMKAAEIKSVLGKISHDLKTVRTFAVDHPSKCIYVA
ncbi:hypothetical protein EON65_18440 [archaeon]|nr:MAG: hypothetical protein EON65_18440 [archaeon]